MGEIISEIFRPSSNSKPCNCHHWEWRPRFCTLSDCSKCDICLGWSFSIPSQLARDERTQVHLQLPGFQKILPHLSALCRAGRIPRSPFWVFTVRHRAVQKRRSSRSSSAKVWWNGRKKAGVPKRKQRIGEELERIGPGHPSSCAQSQSISVTIVWLAGIPTPQWTCWKSRRVLQLSTRNEKFAQEQFAVPGFEQYTEDWDKQP